MDATHDRALLAGYLVALVGWLLRWRLLPWLWPRREVPAFEHPWHAAGWALLAVFARLQPGSDPWTDVWSRIVVPKRLGLAAQVLGEDLAIAILFVRLRAALGLLVTAALVALLFAAGHIPALLEQGATPVQLLRLGFDAGVGLVAFLVLQRSADIWWFFCVHFALDLLQFDAILHAPA